MSGDENNVVYLKGAIASQIVQLQEARRELANRFRKATNELYMVRRELRDIDHQISYLRKQLDKMNDHS